MTSPSRSTDAIVISDRHDLAEIAARCRKLHFGRDAVARCACMLLRPSVKVSGASRNTQSKDDQCPTYCGQALQKARAYWDHQDKGGVCGHRPIGSPEKK